MHNVIYEFELFVEKSSQSPSRMDLLLKTLHSKSEIDDVIRNTEDKVRMSHQS